jgi:group I intron endonuclease
MYDKDMKSGIYKITNLVNGKFYIGSSKNIEERWENHKQHLRGNYHMNPKLQHSWNFHGEDKFDFQIIEDVEPIEKLLLEREQHYFNVWKPYERMIGYNICPTPSGGDTFTHHPQKEDIRKMMSELFSGEGNPMFGRKHSPSTLKEQKEKAKGRYTLNWFITKYGKKEGEQKFQERRMMLSNRPKHIFVHDSPIPTFAGMTHKNGWLEKKKRTQLYFKKHLDEFVELVNSKKYSERQLSEMLDIPRTTIRTRIKQINA